jgi:hypothetical protein
MPIYEKTSANSISVQLSGPRIICLALQALLHSAANRFALINAKAYAFARRMRTLILIGTGW